MKKSIIYCIRLYQKIPGNFHNHCRFRPTCSEYAIEAINEYGVVRGLFMAIKRILKCNPFFKGGYDPVIERKK